MRVRRWWRLAAPREAFIKRVVVIGAGLAGLSCALALSRRGYQVTVLERKSIPGGRASSYDAQDASGPVDNCQHILMRCCTNLIQFYEDAGVADCIDWHRTLYFRETNGRVSKLYGTPGLPAPFHLLPAFFRVSFLSARDKVAVAMGLMRMLLMKEPEPDCSMGDWLRATHQTPRAISRFWEPILVSALNEYPDRCSARYAFMIFRQGFLSHPHAYEMGIPNRPLRLLYGPCVDAVRSAGGEVRFRASVRALDVRAGACVGVVTDEGPVAADAVVSAAPFDQVTDLLPDAWRENAFFRRWAEMDVSPISAVHLWWDRPVVDLPHCALLDTEIQWMFDKSATEGDGLGTYMGLVVSASRTWLPRSRRDIVEIAEREMRAAFPAAKDAVLRNAVVIKEARATFALSPGIDALRPSTATPIDGLYLAGDWVDNGWPATMEAAVRSGYAAAEHLLERDGRSESIRAADLPWLSPLGRRWRTRGRVR